MPQTSKNPAAHRAFADILEIVFNSTEFSETRHSNQPLSGSTPASRALAKYYRERRKIYPIRRRPRTGNPQTVVTEAF